MPTRSALLFSAACALLAGVGTFFVVEREGDPQARLERLRKNISEIPGLLAKHTAKVRPTDGSKSQDSSRAIYLLGASDGTKLTVDAPKAVKPRELEAAAGAMVSAGHAEFVLVESAWTEAEEWWKGLTGLNCIAAERMALVQFPSKPEGVSIHAWSMRYSDAEFEIEETLTFNFRRTGYVAATLAAVFAILLILIAALGWLWRSFLARVRDLSQAWRGEPPQ